MSITKRSFVWKLYAASSRCGIGFFWHNGLGPVKDEWSVNFVMTHEAGNVVVFHNSESKPGVSVSAK